MKAQLKESFTFDKKKFSQYQSVMKDGKKEKPSVIKSLNMCEAVMFSNISKLFKILYALPISTSEPKSFLSKLEKN